MLATPSPSTSPLAMRMSLISIPGGECVRGRCRRYSSSRMPPMRREMEKDGVLRKPMATATPDGTQRTQEAPVARPRALTPRPPRRRAQWTRLVDARANSSGALFVLLPSSCLSTRIFASASRSKSPTANSSHGGQNLRPLLARPCAIFLSTSANTIVTAVAATCKLAIPHGLPCTSPRADCNRARHIDVSAMQPGHAVRAICHHRRRRTPCRGSHIF